MMSGMEKICLLSLAIDRVAKHGDFYLAGEISTEKMKDAIALIKDAVREIQNWDQFIERESEWWVDLEEEVSKIEE